MVLGIVGLIIVWGVWFGSKLEKQEEAGRQRRLVEYRRQGLSDSSWLLSNALPRARQIGRRLYEKGGNDLMLQVHRDLKNELRGASGRELEVAWNGIGEWQG